MGRIFRKAMETIGCGNNMWPHSLKYFLDESELIMMMWFLEDANVNDNEIINCGHEKIGWSERKYRKVFAGIHKTGLIDVKQRRRTAAEITLNVEALVRLSDIMRDYPRLRFTLREYICDKTILELSDSEISKFDRKERRKQKENS